MKQNKFDCVMDFIDIHITSGDDVIKRGILQQIGWSSQAFGNCFVILTGETLSSYIAARRLYFAAEELRTNREKSICDVALDCGYSDQSAFTRAIKTQYGCTPGDIRRGRAIVPDQKYKFANLSGRSADTRARRLWEMIENDEVGLLLGYDARLLEQVDYAVDEYGLDVDTTFAVAELAERLEVPFAQLLTKCVELRQEVESDPAHLTPADEVAMGCGCGSYDEMVEICAYYHCQYFDLTPKMVDAYRRIQN